MKKNKPEPKPAKKMTRAEELRHRISCVKSATGEGYGEKHSLRHFRGATIRFDLDDMRPLVEELRRKPAVAASVYTEAELKELYREYDELVSLVAEAEAVIADPNYPGVDCGRGTS